MPRFFKCLGSLASADQARDKSDIIEGFKYAIDGDSEMGWSMDKLTVICSWRGRRRHPQLTLNFVAETLRLSG